MPGFSCASFKRPWALVRDNTVYPTDTHNKHMYMYLDVSVDLLQQLFNGVISVGHGSSIVLHKLSQDGAVRGLHRTHFNKTDLKGSGGEEG